MPAELRRPYDRGARVGHQPRGPGVGLAARTGRCSADSTLTCLWPNGDPAADVTALHDIRAVVSRGPVVTLAQVQAGP
jgi:hypothetical protein